jgi:hypothetical protein
MDADFSRRLLGGKTRLESRIPEIRPRLCHLPTIPLFLLPITLPIFLFAVNRFLFAVNRFLLEN